MSKAFCASIEIIVIFIFGSVYVVDYVYRLAYIEPALYPQDEAYSIVMNKLFDVLLRSVCQYFIEYCSVNVRRGYWPEVLFFS